MSTERSFGPWLQQHRKVLGLTQVELAQRVGCSKETIRNFESDERRPSRAMAERLASCLGFSADQQSIFVQFARSKSGNQATFPPAQIAALTPRRTMRPPHTNLPVPLTALLGRAHELSTVRRRLLSEQVRLLTLTGPPGIGKTRLAIQSAIELVQAFDDGASFVSLAPILDPMLVASAIAQKLGVKEASGQSLSVTLTEYLRDRHLLLVLDNFEQVLDATPLINELLTTCPWLHILVTSRSALRIRGEHLFLLPPLYARFGRSVKDAAQE